MSSDPITAFILAGGKSTRMGTDKAFLELAGRPLISHALELARSVTEKIKIVGDPNTFASFGTVIPDIYPARGPLAGIHAALSNTATDYNLILAVDLPFLQPHCLKYLITEAKSSSAVVTVPSAEGHLHPLCAVYRKQFGPITQAALDKGKNKIDSLFAGVAVRIIDEAELVANVFSPTQFRNLNTPEDWQQANQDFPA
jgi:molybdopterin-guanine dinucleotide biosynthesis protein A